MTANALTPAQQRVLRFIATFIKRRGFSPTNREIGLALELKSTNGVADHLNALERKGAISREKHLARTIRVLIEPDTTTKPEAA